MAMEVARSREEMQAMHEFMAGMATDPEVKR